MVTYGSIVLCLVLCTGFFIRTKNYFNRNREMDNGPAIVTTIGVIFTFIGITYSLMNFDATNTGASIADFINGMKLAFITSLIGMGCSLLMKLFFSTKDLSKQEEDFTKIFKDMNEKLETLVKIGRDTDSSRLIETLDRSSQSMDEFSKNIGAVIHGMETLPATLVQKFDELSAIMDEAQNKQNGLMEDMVSIARENKLFSKEAYENSEKTYKQTVEFHEKSLANAEAQLAQLQDNTEKIMGMKKSFDNFLHDMAEQNNKVFIDALNETIKDFNNKLTEQFGQNFAKLNDAVEKMVEWQDGYKDEVDRNMAALQEINTVFGKYCQEVLPAVQQSTDNLQTAVTVFSDTSEKNIGIQQNLQGTVENVTAAIIEAQNAVGKMGETHAQLAECLDKYEDHMEEMDAKLSDFVQNALDNLHIEVANNQAEALQTMKNVAIKSQEDYVNKTSELYQAYGKVLQDTKENIDLSVSVMADGVNKYTSNLQQLGLEYDKVIHDIGEQVQNLKAVTDASLREISNTMGSFDDDMKEAVAKGVKEFNDYLHNSIHSMIDTNNGEIKELIAAMSKITERITENYGKIVDRIADIDKMMAGKE